MQHIPTVFIRKYLNEKHTVTLQFEKKLWHIELLQYYTFKRPCKLSTGWVLFVRESKLQAGDVCIFELINREDAVFDVHIFRCHC